MTSSKRVLSCCRRAARGLVFVIIAAWLTPPAAARTRVHSDAGVASAPASRTWVAKRKKKNKKNKKKGKKKKKKKKKKGDVPIENLFDTSAGEGGGNKEAPPNAAPEEAPMLDLSAPPPAEETGVLDLSGAGTADDAAAKEALLRGGQQEGPKRSGKPKKKGGGFDFGGGFEFGGGGDDTGEGGEFDFGIEEFDLGAVDLGSAEQERFDNAIASMSDEDYPTAAQEFYYFLTDEKYKDYTAESEYQLAKALYKMGLLGPSLSRFRAILDQGPSHRRYRKSVEWLFFISRKMADETPVLAELARFRNVKFPKAYRNEYLYLLSKYLFVQAQRFEVERMREKELAYGKKAEEAGAFNFDAADFGDVAAGGGGFNFGGGEQKEGGGDSFDFGGGGGDEAGGGGGFDFGGGGGSDESGGGGGGFDFGSGGGSDESGGSGFDFGGTPGGEPAAPAEEDVPVREEAPKTAKEAIRQGLDLIKDVEDESKFGPRARYLEGLLHYLDNDAQGAVDAFQKVVRMLNPREGSRLDPVLRENGFLSLARVHYGHRQFDRSAYYYDLIDRDSENWLTALFEASWAYYRRGDYEKALGNLLTLHAPFFEKEYFPESQIVKAIIYFEACRYAETRDIIDTFLERFAKVMDEIARIAESKESSEQLYARIKTLQSISTEDEDDVTIRVVNLALGDPEIARAQDVVKQVDDQLALWNQMPDSFRAGKLGRDLLDELKQLAVDEARNAGETTRNKFEEELYELKGLLAQAYRIKIEVVRAERSAIEAKMRGEDSGDAIIPAVARTVVDDEHFYWPYEGEYWRDELGTYQLDFSMCRQVAAR